MFSGSPNSPTRAWASLNATPAPQSCFERDGQSGRLGFTTASAGGSSPGTWWSVITTFMPRALASATASWAEIPQSQVTISDAPCRSANVTPAGPRSYPSRTRCGTNGFTSAPASRSTRVSSAAPAWPSTS